MSDLEERAAKAAQEARCGRCRVVIVSAGSAMGVVTGYYRAVALGSTTAFQLCGLCGLELREFLQPALEDDRAFQNMKDILVEGWSDGGERVHRLQGGADQEGAA